MEALTRGATIKRLFIYHTWSTDLGLLARSHHEAGVQVMHVSED
ncbi:MAG TPA: hypothetical protein VGZ32_20655 [Actinocrinis sp.]|jgi:hypothetical protein|nr:hypothetical protein [Actinocrinis sp.]HEV3172770.1 hypothetical protein [Actinocrinis sp.]